MPAMAGAQTLAAAAPSTSPPGKSSVKVDMVPSLFVMNTRGGSLQGQSLILAGVSPISIVFADLGACHQPRQSAVYSEQAQ